MPKPRTKAASHAAAPAAAFTSFAEASQAYLSQQPSFDAATATRPFPSSAAPAPHSEPPSPLLAAMLPEVRRLSKRDPTTRAKAFAALESLVTEHLGSAEGKNTPPHDTSRALLALAPTLVAILDADPATSADAAPGVGARADKLAALALLKSLVCALRNSAAPLLTDRTGVVRAWVAARADPEAPVARAARETLAAAVPVQGKLFVRCERSFQVYVDDVSAEGDEAGEMALARASALVEAAPSLFVKAECPAESSPGEPIAMQLVLRATAPKKSSKSSHVRIVAYAAAKAIVKFMAESPTKFTEYHNSLEKVALNAVVEPACPTESWDFLLSLLKNIPGFGSPSFPGELLKKITHSVEHRPQSVVYPGLLPLLACLHRSHESAHLLLDALQKKSKSSGLAVFQTLLECTSYLLKKATEIQTKLFSIILQATDDYLSGTISSLNVRVNPRPAANEEKVSANPYFSIYEPYCIALISAYECVTDKERHAIVNILVTRFTACLSGKLDTTEEKKNKQPVAVDVEKLCARLDSLIVAAQPKLCSLSEDIAKQIPRLILICLDDPDCLVDYSAVLKTVGTCISLGEVSEEKSLEFSKFIELTLKVLQKDGVPASDYVAAANLLFLIDPECKHLTASVSAKLPLSAFKSLVSCGNEMKNIRPRACLEENLVALHIDEILRRGEVKVFSEIFQEKSCVAASESIISQAAKTLHSLIESGSFISDLALDMSSIILRPRDSASPSQREFAVSLLLIPFLEPGSSDMKSSIIQKLVGGFPQMLPSIFDDVCGSCIVPPTITKASALGGDLGRFIQLNYHHLVPDALSILLETVICGESSPMSSHMKSALLDGLSRRSSDLERYFTEQLDESKLTLFIELYFRTHPCENDGNTLDSIILKAHEGSAQLANSICEQSPVMFDEHGPDAFDLLSLCFSKTMERGVQLSLDSILTFDQLRGQNDSPPRFLTTENTFDWTLGIMQLARTCVPPEKLAPTVESQAGHCLRWLRESTRRDTTEVGRALAMIGAWYPWDEPLEESAGLYLRDFLDEFAPLLLSSFENQELIHSMMKNLVLSSVIHAEKEISPSSFYQIMNITLTWLKDVPLSFEKSAVGSFTLEAIRHRNWLPDHLLRNLLNYRVAFQVADEIVTRLSWSPSETRSYQAECLEHQLQSLKTMLYYIALDALTLNADAQNCLVRAVRVLPKSGDGLSLSETSRVHWLHLIRHPSSELRKIVGDLLSCKATVLLFKTPFNSEEYIGDDDISWEDAMYEPFKAMVKFDFQGNSIWESISDEDDIEDAYFDAWLFFLSVLKTLNGSSDRDRRLRSFCTTYIRENMSLMKDVMLKSYRVASQKLLKDDEERALQQKAYRLFSTCLETLPALSYAWFNELSNLSLVREIEAFVRLGVSQKLIESQIFGARMLSGSTSTDTSGDEVGELQVRGGVAGSEITAQYVYSDVALEICLRLPLTYPLKPVEVEAGSKVGVSEAQWRKILFAMKTALTMKDGTLAEAVAMWRANLDRHFAGVEDCPICYSVLHLSTGSIPKKACRTCKNKFHAACLCKWFATSNSSACPMCRSAF